MIRLLLLLFPIALLYAAPYSITIKGPFEDTLFDITEDHSRSITVTGFSEYFNLHPATSKVYSDAFEYLSDVHRNKGEQVRLLRLNERGSIIFDYNSNLSLFNRAVSLCKSPEDGYFIGGYTQEGELLIIKISYQGTLRFMKRFGTKNYDKMHHLIALRDGGVLAIGSSMTSRNSNDGIFKQGLGLNDIYITRFDKHGNERWSKKYGTSFDDQGVDAAEAFDGSLIILGNRFEANKRTITLMRLSEEGDQIWQKEYQPESTLDARRLITLKEGNFLAALSFYDTSAHEKSRLLKFDVQGNLLFERNITADASHSITDIKERANGAIVAVGYSTNALQTRAYAATFDTALRPLWEHQFNDFESSRFHALTLLHDGDIAIAGEMIETGMESRDMWIVKLRRDGTMAQLPMDMQGLYARLCHAFKPEIDAGLIRISRDLEIELIAPHLLFKVGVATLTTAQKDFLRSFGTRLLHILHDEPIKTLHVNGHTSSEWSQTDDIMRYLKNANLSARRSYNVMAYLFKQPTNAIYRPWLEQVLSSDAKSYSKRVMEKEKENRKESRRVSFKISQK